MSDQEKSMASGSSGSTQYPRDIERFMDISGVTPEGRPKARVLLRHFLQYHDGTTKDIQLLSVDSKPIVTIFKHGSWVNVLLDFGTRNDMDLRVMWEALSNYRSPANSVSYLPEEIESGFYQTEDGPQMVYFPIMELALSPIGKEDSYMIHGYEPAFFTLAPDNTKGEPCVLQFTFWEESFTVVNDLEPLNYNKIQSEVLAELEEETRGQFRGR